ncbi:MAG: hypothetical protein LBC68_11670 [Prevotellaceae bacterium]|nr:hypothetical protein [Prevotellaceae bacterium]
MTKLIFNHQRDQRDCFLFLTSQFAITRRLSFRRNEMLVETQSPPSRSRGALSMT